MGLRFFALKKEGGVRLIMEDTKKNKMADAPMKKIYILKINSIIEGKIFFSSIT